MPNYRSRLGGASLVLGALGAMLAWVGEAHAQEAFTAVWRAGSDANFAWIADWDSFRAKWEELSKQNLRLVDFDTAIVKGKRQWMGAWRAGSDEHYFFVGMDFKDFEAKWEELGKKNVRLTRMKTYVEGGQRKWAGVWRAGSDGHFLFVGLNWRDFTSKWDELGKKGFRLVDMETYVEGGQRKFAGIWRAGTDPYALLGGLDWQAFTNKWSELSKQNLRLVDLEAYVEGGEKRYAGVWRAGSDGHYLFGGLDANAFRSKFEDLGSKNFRVTRLTNDSRCSVAGDDCCADRLCTGELVCGQTDKCERRKPLDIVWSADDLNRFPLDPHWAIQNYEPHPTSRPDPIELCKLHDGVSSVKECTDTHVIYDVAYAALAADTAIDVIAAIFSGGISAAVQGATGNLTPICPGLLHGHLKWFPVTFNGRIWNHGGPMGGSTRTTLDSDYNFDFIPTNALGHETEDLFTKSSGSDHHYNRGIHMEVNAYEGFGDFKTDWWAKYRDAVDKRGGDEADISMISGSRAIATGWVSLDCAHECHVEIHPLFALAVQDTVAKDSEHWSFFAMNHGSGGYCASNDYEINLAEESKGSGRFVYKFQVPWRPGARSFTLHSGSVFRKHVVADWVGHNTGGHGTDEVAPGKNDVTVQGTPEHGLIIKVVLPAPSKRAAIEGVVGIDWVMDPSAPPHKEPPHASAAASPMPKPGARRREPDEFYNMLLEKLPEAERKKLPAFHPQTSVQSSPPVEIQQVTGPVSEDPRAAEQPTIRSVPDNDKPERIKAHLQAVRKAFKSDAAFNSAVEEVAKKLGIPFKAPPPPKKK